MADISKITLPSGQSYDIKDVWARTQIEAITGGSALVFKGVSSTPLTDNGTENPTVNSEVITEKAIGDIYFYGVGEYIWNGEAWNELGNLSNLGDLAYQDSASTSYQPAGTISTINFTGTTLSMSTSYQPAGTVSQPTFTGTTLDMSTSYQPAGTINQPTFTGTTLNLSTSYQPAGTVGLTTSTVSVGVKTTTSGTNSYQPAGSVAAPTISVNAAGTTTTVKNPTAKTLPSELITGTPSTSNVSNEITYCAVQDGALLLYHVGYNTTDSITTSNVTVKTGDASYTATAPAFTGTTVHLVTDSITVPSSASFTGTTATISASGTPEGSISTPVFTGTTATISVSGTPEGTVSTPTFTGTTATIAVEGTPEGSISTPTFTGTTATITVS